MTKEPTRYEKLVALAQDKKALAEAEAARDLGEALVRLVSHCLVRLGSEKKSGDVRVYVDQEKSFGLSTIVGVLAVRVGDFECRIPCTYQRQDRTFTAGGKTITLKAVTSIQEMADLLYEVMSSDVSHD